MLMTISNHSFGKIITCQHVSMIFIRDNISMPIIIRAGTHPMIDGHEEDEAGLGEDVEDGEEEPQQQQLRHFASKAEEDQYHYAGGNCGDGDDDDAFYECR